jgi:hypothetical protein
MAAKYRTYTIERTVTIVEQVEIEVETSGDEGWDDQEALDLAYEADPDDWYEISRDKGEEYIVEIDSLYE